MLAAFSVALLFIPSMGGVPQDSVEIGMIPEMVVTAPRYEGEDIAYSGMMAEIVVTAPRPTEEELGLMPEVVVIASRNARTISDMDFSRDFHTYYLLLWEESDETVAALAKEKNASF